MKKILLILLTIGLIFSCKDLKKDSYNRLSPIHLDVMSDEINVNVGAVLDYQDLKVYSTLDYTCEWAYGKVQNGKDIKDCDFDTRTVISDKQNILERFNEVGTFLLRLKVDNGESIVTKYFKLNVNAGFDEGIAILNKSENSDSHLSFIKILTPEEQEASEKEVYFDIFKDLNADFNLKNATDIYVSDYKTKGGTEYYPFLISTNDGKGTIYSLDARTMTVLGVSDMSEQGTYMKKFGGEHFKSADFANYGLGANSKPYRYDMAVGFIYDGSPSDETFTHVYKALYTTPDYNNRRSKTNIDAVYLSENYVGKKKLSIDSEMIILKEDGYKIINIGNQRVFKSATSSYSFYTLMQSIADPTEFKIKATRTSLDAYSRRGRIKYKPKDILTFNTDKLNMDINSKILNTSKSDFVYYNYNNKIYRWNLVSAPETTPSIELPDGEQIRDICMNFMGKTAKGEGEDKIYIATYNPNRSGEHKGSVYIYNISDNSLVKAYEGICDDPVSIVYKYRMN